MTNKKATLEIKSDTVPKHRTSTKYHLQSANENKQVPESIPGIHELFDIPLKDDWLGDV